MYMRNLQDKVVGLNPVIACVGVARDRHETVRGGYH